MFEFNNRRAARGVLTVAIVCIGALSGCSDSPERSAWRKVREAIDEARRHCDSAIAKMANPTYTVDGKSVPIGGLPKRVAADRIKLAPAGTLDENALKHLQLAQRGLSEVFSENRDDLDGEAQAIALAVLGRIATLKGTYHAMSASISQDKAISAHTSASIVLGMMATRLQLMKYYDSVIAMSNEDVEEMIASAGEEIDKSKARLTEVQGETAALGSERDTLAAGNNDQMKKSRKLRLDSELASGEKRLELLRQAQDIEAQVGEATSRIARIELSTESLNIEEKALRSQIAFNEEKIAVAKEIIAERQAGDRRSIDSYQSFCDALAAARVRVEDLAGEIADACEEADVAEDLALSVFDLAGQHFYESRNLEKSSARGPSVDQAQALMSRGDLQTLQLALHALNTKLVADVRATWAQLPQEEGMPSELIRRLEGYVTNPPETRESGAKDYGEAVGLLKKSLRSLRGDDRIWIYQGMLANAYMAQYRMSPADHELLANAEEQLRSAIEGRDGSRYLRDLVKLQQLLYKMQQAS